MRGKPMLNLLLWLATVAIATGVTFAVLTRLFLAITTAEKENEND
jgi:hypothetical protein